MGRRSGSEGGWQGGGRADRPDGRKRVAGGRERTERESERESERAREPERARERERERERERGGGRSEGRKERKKRRGRSEKGVPLPPPSLVPPPAPLAPLAASTAKLSVDIADLRWRRRSDGTGREVETDRRTNEVTD